MLGFQVVVECLVAQTIVALLAPRKLLAAYVAGGLVGGPFLGTEVLPQFAPLYLANGTKLTFIYFFFTLGISAI